MGAGIGARRRPTEPAPHGEEAPGPIAASVRELHADEDVVLPVDEVRDDLFDLAHRRVVDGSAEDDRHLVVPAHEVQPEGLRTAGGAGHAQDAWPTP